MKRKKYKISNKQLANWFKYSSLTSFNNSKAKDDVTNGVEKLINHIENYLIKELNK